MRAYRTMYWAAAALSLAILAACGDDDGGGNTPDAKPPTDASDPTGDAQPEPQTIRVTGNITADTTWSGTNTYVLAESTTVFVTNGATLTIEPGTVVKGERGSLLVITRGAKINAAGTRDKPILLTSAEPDDAKTRGFWGGLLVLGAAPINVNVNSAPPSTEATFEAFPATSAEGKFGGANPADNSGVIKYVRIDFAGFSYVEGREFNNFTLCGVGSGTEIDYVQVHGGSDDGIELFGGTVNVKHIISSQNQDDGFDTDNGWNGKAQFIIIQHVTPAGTDASNGYESDNHATAASYTADPRTLPTIYNATLIGKRDHTAHPSFAAIFRRGTGGHYFNHLIVGFPTGIEVRDAATKAQLDGTPNPNLTLKSSVVFGMGAAGTGLWPAPQASNDIVESDYFTATNTFTDPGLPAAATSLTAPVFKPATLATGATPPNDGFFDPTATFIGAVGNDDWTAGWTAFPQPIE
ncbi:MAG TPA: hypothetical protein VM734_05960 [Kofleriaceae bacterium]|nr:hypothetical protein [Kofleriaceae bacterium]